MVKCVCHDNSDPPVTPEAINTKQPVMEGVEGCLES